MNYGADHLEAATFVQRPNRFDLDQKIKINSKKIFRGVESFKSSKNKLFRCRIDGKLTITQLFLTRLLLMRHICHNYTTIYGSLYAIYGRWPNLSGHVTKNSFNFAPIEKSFRGMIPFGKRSISTKGLFNIFFFG